MDTSIIALSDTLLEIIEKYVRSSGYINHYEGADTIQYKIDLLERTLEILRIKIKHLENNLPMEDFIQGRLEIDDNCLHYIVPKEPETMGSGTAPILLQPKLLMFLLFRHHRGYYKVYDIIDSFIHTLWDYLEPLDFKRTRTGVIRCFTNTRFAANTLRQYGLLKFTKREAYKTWVLSLPGILVASKLVENPNLEMPPIEGKTRFDLHPDIRRTFGALINYNAFVQRLASVSRAGTRLFEDFKEVSLRAYSLLQRYWTVLQDESLSKTDRKTESLKRLEEIEQDDGIREFYDKFSRSLKVGDLRSLR